MESEGSWSAELDRKGKDRSRHGSVRMSVGSSELKARLFGSTGVRVRVWDGLEGPKGATTGNCVAMLDNRTPVGQGPTGVRWLPWPSIGFAKGAGSQSGHEGRARLHQVGSRVHQVLTNQKDELTKDLVAGVGHEVRLRQGSREAGGGQKRSRKSWESQRRREY